MNVRVENGRLYADYCYEDQNDVGSVVLNVKTGELLEKHMNAFDTKYNGIYTFTKVVRFLREMIEYDKYLPEATLMWY
jgi:hypothetical protein